MKKSILSKKELEIIFKGKTPAEIERMKKGAIEQTKEECADTTLDELRDIHVAIKIIIFWLSMITIYLISTFRWTGKA